MRKKKAVREEICSTAKELFIDKGYDAVSIDEVCDRVGISKPTFYAANLSKYKLLIDAYHLNTQKLIEHREEEPLECIKQCVLQAFRRMASCGKDLLLSLYKISLDHLVFEQIFDEAWSQTLLWALNEAKQRKEILSDASAEDLTNMVSAYVVGFCMRYVRGNLDIHEEDLLDGLHAVIRVPVGVVL